MKKILYFLSSLMIVLTSCDPMEDVYEELDQLKGPYTKKGLTLTLADADYKTSTKYFVSEEAAAAAIPTILNAKFPALENGSTVTVGFNLFVDKYDFLGNTVSKYEAYELESSDYALGGAKFLNFDRWSQVETFLNAKFPAQEVVAAGKSPEGRLVKLTYTWYNSNTNPTSKTVTNSFYYIGGQWIETYLVSAEDYVSVDRNRFNNFIGADEDLLPVYFNKFLKENIINAQPWDVKYVSYAFRSGSTTLQQVMAMMFDGTNWIKVTKGYTLTEETSLQFAKKNGVWVPDLTKRYTLVAPDDYVWISQQAALGTEEQRENLAKFKNFYQSYAGNNYYWSNANIVTALAGLMKNKFPNEEVGQKFEVSYAFYAGGAKTGTIILIKRESGNYEEPREDEL